MLRRTNHASLGASLSLLLLLLLARQVRQRKRKLKASVAVCVTESVYVSVCVCGNCMSQESRGREKGVCTHLHHNSAALAAAVRRCICGASAAAAAATHLMQTADPHAACVYVCSLTLCFTHTHTRRTYHTTPSVVVCRGLAFSLAFLYLSLALLSACFSFCRLPSSHLISSLSLCLPPAPHPHTHVAPVLHVYCFY